MMMMMMMVMMLLKRLAPTVGFAAAGGDIGESDQESDFGEGEAPTLASVLDTHPGVKVVTNKVKKCIRSKISSLQSSKNDLVLIDFLKEVLQVVNSVFDVSFVDCVICLMTTSLALGGDESNLSAALLGVPSLSSHRKMIKSITHALGNHASRAKTFVVHRAVSCNQLRKGFF